MLQKNTKSGDMPVLAVSVKPFHSPGRLQTIINENLSVEYTPDRKDFADLKKRLKPCLDSGVKVRFHGFFPEFDIGDANSSKAKEAVRVHLACLDAIKDLGEPFLTIHSGVNRQTELRYDILVENLSRVVDHGRGMGIRVAIENLKKGLTSDPEILLDLSVKTNARITLDLGHAVTSSAVATRRFNVIEIVEMFQDRLSEVHFYEKELDRHYPPKDLSILGPIMDRLLLTDCRWWTIELDDFNEVRDTVALIQSRLSPPVVIS